MSPDPARKKAQVRGRRAHGSDALGKGHKRGGEARTELSAELEAKRLKIVELLGKSYSDVATARYAIGVEVMAVMKDPEKYGKRAVRQLAEAVGRDEDSFYAYAKVAEVWPPKEFKALVKLRDPRGLPLSFTLLTCVAKQNGAKTRERWIKRAIEQGLSFRELKKAIEAEDKQSAKQTEATGNGGGVEEALRTLHRFSASLVNQAATWRNQMAEAVSKGSTPGLREQLTEALKEQRALREVCADNIRGIEALLGPAAASPSTPTEPNGA